METTLIRIFCLIAAVAMHEAGVESELVARVAALEEKTAARPMEDRQPVERRVYRAAWREMKEEVSAAVKKHRLNEVTARPSVLLQRRLAAQ